MADKEILLDAKLIGDPDALREMGAQPAEVLMDPEYLEGARVLIVKRGAETGDEEQDGGAVVRLDCAFHPAPGTRFVSARVMVKLIQPQGAMFLDIAPREIREPVKVEYSGESNGKLSVKLGPISFEPAGTATSKVGYDSFICRVKGSGANSLRAIWDFEEDAVLKQGIGLDQALAMIVPGGRTVKGELSVTARLARNGALGSALDMLLGGGHEEHAPEVTLYRCGG